MCRPLIGISCPRNVCKEQIFLSERYFYAIWHAGGQPVLLWDVDEPSGRQLAGILHGLVLSGGGDMSSNYFHAPQSVQTRTVDAVRDNAELILVHAFLAQQKPIFGICRGHQLLNVALGGTLCQHLPTAEKHELPKDQVGDIYHPVALLPNCLLSRIWGETPTVVNSSHHQGIDTLSPALLCTAWSDDDVCEAYEGVRLPLLGVQFHPERMKEPASTALFAHFITQCTKQT